jgi:predicted TIM-barrel fold metal-dependent hydrolase
MRRRQVLQHGVMAAGLASLPGALRLAAAQDRAPAVVAQPRVLVDWHSHFVSRAEIKALGARREPPRLLAEDGAKLRLQNADTASAAAGLPAEIEPSDIATRLRHLDEHGIERQVLSHTVALGLDATLPIEELRPLFRAFNDELAQVVHTYPDRFLAVAALPTADPSWAAEELRRAHRELRFIGGSLPLNAFSTLAGARTLAPIFEAAQSLGSHLFVHRGPASSRIPGQPPIVLPEDTAYARWSLISNAHLAAGGITLGLTDFLDPYPDVSVQVIMLAGFLPYLVDTLVPAARKAGVKDPLARLRRIYVDPGPYSRNAEWVRLALSKLGADRILFGTDYGVGGGARGDVGPAISTLQSALAPAERQLIFVDNSRALLRKKGWTI